MYLYVGIYKELLKGYQDMVPKYDAIGTICTRRVKKFKYIFSITNFE